MKGMLGWIAGIAAGAFVWFAWGKSKAHKSSQNPPSWGGGTGEGGGASTTDQHML